MIDCDEYVAFRGAINGIYEHEDIMKLMIINHYKWTEEEYLNTSIDFIFKCYIYLQEKQKKLNKKNGR